MITLPATPLIRMPLRRPVRARQAFCCPPGAANRGAAASLIQAERGNGSGTPAEAASGHTARPISPAWPPEIVFARPPSDPSPDMENRAAQIAGLPSRRGFPASFRPAPRNPAAVPAASPDCTPALVQRRLSLSVNPQLDGGERHRTGDAVGKSDPPPPGRLSRPPWSAGSGMPSSSSPGFAPSVLRSACSERTSSFALPSSAPSYPNAS